MMATLLAALVVVNLVSLTRFERARAEAERNVELRRIVRDVLEALLDAETGQRGYLLTGDERDLEPFVRGRDQLAGLEGAIALLVEGHPRQQERVRELQRAAGAKLDELAATVALRKAGRAKEALARVNTGEGRELMERARAVVSELRLEQDRILAERNRQAHVGFVVALGVEGAAGSLVVILALVLFAIDRDIRRRRELEGELRRAADELGLGRERLATTLHSIGDAVIASDAAGAVSFMNPVAEALTGWTAAEASGHPLRDIFVILDETTRAPVESPVDKVLRDGKVVALANHTVLVRKDGREVAIDDSAAPIRDRDGKLAGVVLVFRDVSKQRRSDNGRSFLARATAELGSSLDYQSTLTSVARLAVPDFADWCAVDIVDGAALRRLAVAHRDPKKVELVAEIERRFPTPPDAPTGTPEVLRSGKPQLVSVITDEMIAQSATSEEQLALVRRLELRSYLAAPLIARGRIIGVITFAMAESRRNYDDQDLTVALTLADRAAAAIDNARLYREAEALRVRAELANRAKDEFLAILGHELRNPLAPILTALQLMSMRGSDDSLRERTIIERQVRHVGRLVDDLLDVSRIARGTVDLVKEPTDLADVVARALEMAGPLLEEREHSVEVAIADGLIVDGDGVRLAQVMANLLNNAAKYTERRGHVRITGERRGDDIVVRVSDDGIGIAPEVLPHVFDLFVQEQQTLDRARGGLGLGLAIVRSLVTLHGGSVSARSDGVGKGTELTVVLPASRSTSLPSRSPKQQHAVVSAAAPPQAPRLLVVDDNADAAELLSEALSLLGYETHRAGDGPSAIVLAGKVKPRVALLDIGLPVMDGYELAGKLRALDGLDGLKLIAVTGYGQPSDRERSRAAGFDAHLVKPVTLEAVRKAIESLTGGEPASVATSAGT